MISQKQELRLSQKLSPKQILLMKLLQLPTVSLEQRVKQELEENPALESSDNDEDETNLSSEKEEGFLEDDYDNTFEANDSEQIYDAKDIDLNDYFADDYGDVQGYRNYSNNQGENTLKEIPYISRESFQENLLLQLGMFGLSDEDTLIAEYIIGNIDDSGYLQRNPREMANDMMFSQNIKTTKEHIQHIIDTVIHHLDPPGVGASSLQECLLLQLERMDDDSVKVHLAKKIAQNYFEEFTKKHYDKILSRLRCSKQEMDEALAVLLKLDPKPGNNSNDLQQEALYISPDFIVIHNDKNGNLELTLPKYNMPELSVRKSYSNLYNEIKEKKNISQEERKAALDFVRQKVTSAEWFIDSISQREATLYKTMKTIMDYQKTFFQTGDETTLKPMILKDIAEKIEMDISTVSRVASSKYVLTPYGLYSLKFFFSESMQTSDGKEVSSHEIKKILSDAIESENKEKPLTDDALCNILNEKGYTIARRTVAKYREQLGFPVARLRK